MTSLSDTEVGSESFRVDLRTARDCRIIALAGEFDLSGLPQFERAFRLVHGTDPERVMLDLSELQFIDSTGISGIVTALSESETAGRPLEACGIRGQVQEVLSLVGVLPRLRLAPRPVSAVPWSPTDQ